MCYFMSNLYQPVKISKYQRTIRSIRTLAKQGKTRQEIAVKLQLTYGTVSYYSVKEGIDIQKMPRGRKGADILLIKQELKKGKRLFFIADELKLTGCSLYRVLIKTEISTRQPALSELEIKTLQDSLRTMDDKTRKVVQGVLESKSQTTIADDTGLTKNVHVNILKDLVCITPGEPKETSHITCAQKLFLYYNKELNS